MRRRFALLCLVLVSGCQSGIAKDRGTSGRDARPSQAQEELTLGTKLLHDRKYDQAEKHLSQALSLDPFSGLAHNNLGTVYYEQGKMYDAAKEFQEATKFLPLRPEPHNNLGMVLEAGGKLDDAIAEYQKAVNFQPQNAQLIGNLARAHVRRGDRDAQTRQLLTELIRFDNRTAWREWASKELATHYP